MVNYYEVTRVFPISKKKELFKHQFDTEKEARQFVDEYMTEQQKVSPEVSYEHRVDGNDFHEEWHSQNNYTQEILVLDKRTA